MNTRSWLKLLSVLLGIFAWIYVNLVMPPQIRRNLTAEIEYRNLPELMKVIPEKPTVKVQIEGSRRDFILSQNNKLSVSLDLYNLRPGTAQLPVRVTAAPGLSVVSVSPPQINIEALPLIRKTFKVSILATGQIADGYLADDPRISPANISIEGPDHLVSRIATCQVEINLEKIKNSISEQKSVIVLLDSGITSNELLVTPDKVSVDVTVKQGYPSKMVPLAKPLFINKLPEGRKLESYKLTPEAITISGPTRILNSIQEISFNPIDLAKIHESASFSVKLELPDTKVNTTAGEIPTIEISLTDSKVKRTLSGLPFELKKSDDQYPSVSVSSYSLELEGYVKDLDNVSNTSLKMILDIEKMAPGSYTVSLSAPSGLPKQISVLKIYPESLQIQISQLASETNGQTELQASETETLPQNEEPKQ